MRIHRLLKIFWLVPLLAMATMPASADPDPTVQDLHRLSDAFAEVVAKAKPAVVTVFSEQVIQVSSRENPYHGQPEGGAFEDFFRRFFPTPPSGEQRRQGLGSGVIVSPEGYILTNNHVVDQADEIRIELPDGREFEAQVVGKDDKTDLAVLKVEADGELPALGFGDSDGLRVGQWVLALGNPFRLQHTVTFGIVSATGRGSLGLADYENFIQTDAAINPGNSGGALIDLHGKVMGINTAIASRTGGYQGVGFAIPANMAQNIMRQLIDNGEVSRGWLGVGIQDLSTELVEAMGLESSDGILVREVLQDSPAEKAGLRQADVIIGVDKTTVNNVGELRNHIAQTPPGTPVRLRVLREGEERIVRVELGKLSEEGGSSATPAPSVGRIGIDAQELTPELAERLGYQGEQGVLVASVRSGSAAERAQLRAGDLIREIDRKPITDLNNYQNAIDAAQPGKVALLLVKREDNSFFVALRVPHEE